MMIITNDDYCILKTVKFHLIFPQQEYEELSLRKNKSQESKKTTRQEQTVLFRSMNVTQ